jgi:H+/Cl- antiporter ClcA
MLGLARFKRLKAPEFVENNGGWWPFAVFIGVPAIIAIAGLADPIFDRFLSLFSVDSQGHVSTYWEVKYVLFFVFFLFMPTAIYLLVRGFGPAPLKDKAGRAYDLVNKEVSRVIHKCTESLQQLVTI